jgi:hypothetical protein
MARSEEMKAGITVPELAVGKGGLPPLFFTL